MTYSEIRRSLGVNIPQSTLSYWLRSVKLSATAKQKRELSIKALIARARLAALKANRETRAEYLRKVQQNNEHLAGVVKDKTIAKLILTTLYIGEGSKQKNGALMFGNSDPNVVRAFMQLLRYCYPVEERKFRCTVQCRADHNVKYLERFWAAVTGVPKSQFYKTRIDPRTIGKPSKKLDYKGVCRIDYLSAAVFHDLSAAMNVVMESAGNLLIMVLVIRSYVGL